MERTLIKQGHAGFTIYLPKEWVLRNGLGPRGKVEVIEDGNNIIVQSNFNRRKTIDMKKVRHSVRNVLLQAFRMGTKELRLENVTAEQRKEIEQITSSLLPHVLVDPRQDVCILKEVLEQPKTGIDSLVRKLFYTIKETQLLIRKAIFEGIDVGSQVRGLSTQADIVVTICKNRLFAGSVKSDRALYWEFLTLLVFIEHGYRYLAMCVEGKATKEVQELFENTEESVLLLLDGFMQKKVALLDRIKCLRDKLPSKEDPRRIERTVTQQLYHLREILRLTHMAMISALSIVLVEMSPNEG